MKELYFSGIQPTGTVHLGNYLGALKQWIELQKEHKCIFCIVDLHAITIPQDPIELNDSILKMLAMYMAVGIDPNQSIIFVQSTIKEHLELFWILSCLTPIGWLSRMTQYKDKIAKNPQNASLGLFAYPILMAADILLYKATHVPVGNDQKQHVELARDVAQLINNRLNTEFFPLPEPVIPAVSARIMSLKDGTKKMSKSAESDLARINLIDTDDCISNKIRKAKTDTLPIPFTESELSTRPEVMNLISIYASLAGTSIQNILNLYGGHNFANFKQELTGLLIAVLSPIRNNYFDLIMNKDHLISILAKSSEQAQDKASETVKELRKLIGLFHI